MKVLITGSRSNNLWGFIFDTLDILNENRGPITHVIVGGASGVDHWGEEWAKERGIAVSIFPADWDKHGRAAGPIRNTRMLEEKPDAVIQFEGGRGTANMVMQARRAGIEVIEVDV